MKLPKFKRVFTPEQWLRRDLRSAATRSAKKGIKPTLPKLKCLEPIGPKDGRITQGE